MGLKRRNEAVVVGDKESKTEFKQFRDVVKKIGPWARLHHLTSNQSELCGLGRGGVVQGVVLVSRIDYYNGTGGGLKKVGPAPYWHRVDSKSNEWTSSFNPQG